MQVTFTGVTVTITGVTRMLIWTVGADSNEEFPGCAACTTIVPTPVMLKTSPELIFPGPLTIDNVTGKPDEAVAVRTICVTL
jgi:hypothetical protein